MHNATHDVESWTARDDPTYSHDAWNDEAAEEAKEFYIEGPDDNRVAEYLNRIGLISDFDLASRFLAEHHALGGEVLDLGAGTCWLSALLSRCPEITNVDAVDFSWHRLAKLSENTIISLGGQPARINRIYGSFYDIRRPPAFYSSVWMAQAYHHAHDPANLLREISRCLVPNGYLVLLGEIPVTPWRIAKRFVRRLLLEGRVCLRFDALFPAEDEWGDHYYTMGAYRRSLASAGFEPTVSSGSIGNPIIFARKLA